MRKAERVRKTNETDIELAFTIDGGDKRISKQMCRL